MAVVTHNGSGGGGAAINGGLGSNRNSRDVSGMMDQLQKNGGGGGIFDDDGVAVDEEEDDNEDDDDEVTDVGDDEEILDVEDLLKTKNRANVQLVEIGTESGFHDIYDHRKVTFYGENNDADCGCDDNNNSSSQSKTDKRKSGGSSHSSFSSSSTSSGIISANNDEFKIIMKNNYECTLLMVNNDAEEEDEEQQEGGIRGFRVRHNGYGTLKNNGHQRPTTDREFNKRMSYNGELVDTQTTPTNQHHHSGGDNEHGIYFSGSSQNVMNQSFISADGVTRVLVMDGGGGGAGTGGGGGGGTLGRGSKRDDEHHIPKCMKLILGWYSLERISWLTYCSRQLTFCFIVNPFVLHAALLCE